MLHMLCPQCVHEFSGFDMNENVSQTCLDIVKLTPSASFEEVEEGNMEEVPESCQPVLSNEDLFEHEK
jgi:hypothetical protein